MITIPESCVAATMCIMFACRLVPWPALKGRHSKQSHHALQDVVKVKFTVLPHSVGSFRLPHIAVLIHYVGTSANANTHTHINVLFSSCALRESINQPGSLTCTLHKSVWSCRCSRRTCPDGKEHKCWRFRATSVLHGMQAALGKPLFLLCPLP